jgi:hypothetical protein
MFQGVMQYLEIPLLQVVVGEHNLNSNEGTEQTVLISQAICSSKI